MGGSGSTFSALAIIPGMVCDPQEMAQYIDLSHDGIVHLNVSMESISAKLCQMTKSYTALFDLAKVLIEELDLGTFFGLVRYILLILPKSQQDLLYLLI